MGDLATIQERFCTTRERPFGRNHFGIVPEYDPGVESLLQVTFEKPARAVILTRHERLGSFRYIVLRKDGYWRIDSKRIDRNGKWGTWTL